MKRVIDIKTDDGIAPAAIFHSDDERRPSTLPDRPGIVLYMDAFGPRPALDAIAQRLANHGYAVLLPDLFYRYGAYGPFDAKRAFTEEQTRPVLMGMIRGTSQEATRRDTAAFLRVLEQEGVKGPVGTVGYCMGGSRALNAAAAYPERIVAAASFHGGHLAGETPDSPHRHAATIRAKVYVGSAGVDKSFPPEQSARLAQALREAEVDHVIENYVGMDHGWAVSDHNEYNPEGAERHWKRLLTFFEEALG
ncbi:dienelactone hydrolase family protein [Microvirga rosea]|uniref:dienelactone hydrolase family protein n=1 Tax=Microvirga rosea TaxID=2715425 RepID=UPI001D0BB846|nr:dienelactone hydrolase family protein [Microvirga rosea]MCB8821052.1 dienelactone hydrolase family protein [Microvirga rosea]